jgi:hypothetical protein
VVNKKHSQGVFCLPQEILYSSGFLRLLVVLFCVQEFLEKEGGMMKKCDYWDEMRLKELDAADSFRQLGQIALRVLRSFPEKTHGNIFEVCGPISTGGLGCITKNTMVLNYSIHALRRLGYFVFDQTPMRSALSRLFASWSQSPQNSGYCQPILDEVFLPIFESGLIGTLTFLPDWKTSTGSIWEYQQAIRIGLRTEMYAEKEYFKVLGQLGLELPRQQKLPQ